MSDPFIGEIRIFANSYVPEGWMLCDGSTLAIKDYQALFAVISISFGGDGKNNFCLPNLMGRVAMGPCTASNGPGGQARILGQSIGAETVALRRENIPNHTHQLEKLNPSKGNAQKTSAPSATSNFDALVTALDNSLYKAVVSTSNPPLISLDGSGISTTGSASPAVHENRQPFLALFHAIAYWGIFPVHA